MKELSIEEKARAYDEALERADKINKGYADDREPGTTLCEYIFPELKESEDERIKREIIELVSIAGNGNQFEEIKDWLEKQKNTQDKEYVFRPFAGEAIEKAAERAVELDDKVVLAFNGAYIPVGNKTKDEIVAEYRNWIEKQGEHKPYGQRKECEDCQFNYAGKCKGSCQMKRDEQKPTDKLEPKFHPGDWITNGQLTCKVLGVVGKSYELHLYNDDYCHFETDVQSVDEDYCLWTITDAKDGDVLVDVYGNIGIFEQYDDFDWSSYCSLGVNGGFQYFTVEHENEKTHPATKEQIELLFQKMKEAGWEWDAEKKELNEVEFKKLDAER